MRVQLAVIGAGPAGCAAAIRASDQGLDTVIIGRRDHTPDRIERVAPFAASLLHRLGLCLPSPDLDVAECPGIRTVQGLADTVRRSIFDPYGSGWTVRRSRLHHWLLRAALAKKAAFIDGRVQSIARTGADWTLSLGMEGEGRTCLRARHLLVATGRSRSVLAMLGSSLPRAEGPAITIVRPVSDPPSWWIDDPLLLVELGSSGWHYGILHRGQAEIGVTCPARRLEGRSADELWVEEIGRTRLLKKAAAHSRSLVRARASEALRSTPDHGEGWAAIGDACIAHRPVEGQGIAFAIESAVRATDNLVLPSPEYREWLADYESVRQSFSNELLRSEMMAS